MMQHKFTITVGLACAALLSQLPAAHAQSSVKVLKGKEVQETAIIDALAPDDEVRTRSIRVRPNASGAPAGPTASASSEKAGSASIAITFETNSAEISAQSKSALDVVGRALKSDRLTNLKFAVEGHADPRGGEEYNLKLSQARAESVVDYLVKEHGVERDRLVPVGKGDHELANRSVPTAPENRRVTFKTQVQ